MIGLILTTRLRMRHLQNKKQQTADRWKEVEAGSCASGRRNIQPMFNFARSSENAFDKQGLFSSSLWGELPGFFLCAVLYDKGNSSRLNIIRLYKINYTQQCCFFHDCVRFQFCLKRTRLVNPVLLSVWHSHNVLCLIYDVVELYSLTVTTNDSECNSKWAWLSKETRISK